MSFDDYMDHAGLLVNKLSPIDDSGDSAQMMGLLRFGQYLTYVGNPDMLGRTIGKMSQDLDVLTYVESVKDKEGVIVDNVAHQGTYVRHPPACYPTWAANPGCFSRDQQQSLVIAAGALGQRSKLWTIFKLHVKRFGFYQNNVQIDGTPQLADFATPDRLGEYLRAFYMAGCWYLLPLWPLLVLTDLCAFIGLVVSFYNWRDKNQADDDGLVMTMLQAKKALPTPVSWLIRKLFKWFRPGGYDYGMKTKHRQETGSPPFNDLYLPILQKEL